MYKPRLRQALQAHAAAIIASSFLLGIAIPTILWVVNMINVTRCNAEYALVSPLHRCAPLFSNQKKEYEAFQDELKLWIASQKDVGTVQYVSVYFRDLDNGPWFGVGEEDQFAPASLLKVPILMAILKEAQTTPDLLTDQIRFNGGLGNITNELDPEHTITVGQTYSVTELLDKMIIYSDNNAKELLKSWLRVRIPNRDIVAETYQNLGIIQDENLDMQLTVKSYASIFRTLYNASYLTPSMSQKGLDLLSHVSFHQGIVAGVPGDIPVAHKFGVRNVDQLKQLHDCGIVYEPGTPYLLCVMTRGKDLHVLAGVIKEISHMVYMEVASRQ